MVQVKTQRTVNDSRTNDNNTVGTVEQRHVPGNKYEFGSSSSLADMFQLETFIRDESTDLGESSWPGRPFSSCASFFNNSRLVELVTGGTTVSNRDRRSRNSWSVMNSPIATVHRTASVPTRNGPGGQHRVVRLRAERG